MGAKKVVIVSDTDGHGVSLAAAYLAAALDTGYAPGDVAVISHFDPRGPSTSGRGDIAAVINVLSEWAAQHPGATVYFLDVPLAHGKEAEIMAALSRLKDSAHVVWVDHVGHSEHYAGAPLPGTSNIDFRLVNGTIETFTPAVVADPAPKLLELALFGTASDMALTELPPRGTGADRLAGLVMAASEANREAVEKLLEEFSVPKIRENYNLFSALDAALKFGRLQPSLGVEAVGNMAGKAVALAEGGLHVLVEAAKPFLDKLPTMDEVRENVEQRGAVAVLKMEAPKGQVFKFAGLAAAASSAPVVLAYGEGFQPGKKIIVVANNVFEAGGDVENALRELKGEVFQRLVQAGISDPQTDFPRGDAAFSLGVKADRLGDAIDIVVKAVNDALPQASVSAAAKQFMEEKLAVMVPDPVARAALVGAIEEALRMFTAPIYERLSRIESALTAAAGQDAPARAGAGRRLGVATA